MPNIIDLTASSPPTHALLPALPRPTIAGQVIAPRRRLRDGSSSTTSSASGSGERRRGGEPRSRDSSPRARGRGRERRAPEEPEHTLMGNLAPARSRVEVPQVDDPIKPEEADEGARPSQTQTQAQAQAQAQAQGQSGDEAEGSMSSAASHTSSGRGREREGGRGVIDLSANPPAQHQHHSNDTTTMTASARRKRSRSADPLALGSGSSSDDTAHPQPKRRPPPQPNPIQVSSSSSSLEVLEAPSDNDVVLVGDGGVRGEGAGGKGKGKKRNREPEREATPDEPVENLLESYQCPICLSPPTSPVLTTCGHIMCAACLFSTLKSAAIRDHRKPLEPRTYPQTTLAGRRINYPRGQVRPPLLGRIVQGLCPVCRFEIEGGMSTVPGEGGVRWLEAKTVTRVAL